MADVDLPLREVVARRMLADELAKVPHRFDDAWGEEAEAWLRNADSALAAVADMLRAGGDTVRGVWYPWDSEQRGYAAGFAERISPEKRS